MSAKSGESTIIPWKVTEDRAPESIPDIEDWLNWNHDLDNPNDSEEDYASADESDIEYNNGIKHLECQEEHDVSITANVPGLGRPTRKSKRQAKKLFVTVNAVKMQRNKRGKKK
jgi:hypothetical protein